jgi:ATP-dependent Clp protease ATP-binding subunit ClpA
VDVEAIINRGGSAPATQPQESQKGSARKSVIVYFEPEMLQRVDDVASSQVIKTSRQRWIMEAIVEKLQREEGRE